MKSKDIAIKCIHLGILFVLIYVSISPTGISIDISSTLVQNVMDEETLLYVGGSGLGNYTQIQDAVDAASTGDIVFVYDDSSPYYENVIINKSISLIGEDKNTTIINTKNNLVDFIVCIISDEVNICGFTINGSRNADYSAGLRLCSSNNMITNCIIINNNNGIVLQFTLNNSIDNCMFIENEFGVFVKDSGNCTISNNTFIKNDQQSIYITCFSRYNKILYNNITNNHNGIYLQDLTNNNIIFGNTISSNKNVGIHLFYGANNSVFNNNFINNYRHAIDEATNIWNLSYPFGGNYWDNHPDFVDNFSGPDQDIPGSDGICDNPYNISGYGENQDRYPFMRAHGWLYMPDPNQCVFELTYEPDSYPGLNTCPARNGENYKYLKVQCLNYIGEPFGGVSANVFSIQINPVSGDTDWFGDLACALVPMDSETDENGEIFFEITDVSSVIGNASIQVLVMGMMINDIEQFSFKSYDLNTDGAVNLLDFIMFAQTYNRYSWKTNYDWTGIVNLIDFALFAHHYNH